MATEADEFIEVGKLDEWDRGLIALIADLIATAMMSQRHADLHAALDIEASAKTPDAA